MNLSQQIKLRDEKRKHLSAAERAEIVQRLHRICNYLDGLQHNKHIKPPFSIDIASAITRLRGVVRFLD